MANTVKKRDKVPSTSPKRKQRMVCLMSEEEVRIVDAYLKKYKISNKARWLRETVLTFIHQKMEELPPLLIPPPWTAAVTAEKSTVSSPMPTAIP